MSFVSAYFFVLCDVSEFAYISLFISNTARVFVTPPPDRDVSSVHSYESEPEPQPVYPATATLQPFAVDGDAALMHTMITPVVGEMAPDESDVDEAIAPEGYNRRHRNNNTRTNGDPRGASEVAWNQPRSQQYVAPQQPADVVVPRAVVARHTRNAPVVRAQIMHTEIPEADQASVNYGQYGSNVAVAEAFVSNS